MTDLEIIEKLLEMIKDDKNFKDVDRLKFLNHDMIHLYVSLLDIRIKLLK